MCGGGYDLTVSLKPWQNTREPISMQRQRCMMCVMCTVRTLFSAAYSMYYDKTEGVFGIALGGRVN